MSTIFPAGTKTIFNQTSAPTGWTKDVSFNNAALRVVSGAASSGGSEDFTSVFTQHTFSSVPFGSAALGATTLAWPQIAPHGHVHAGPTATRRAATSTASTPGTVPAPTPNVTRLNPGIGNVAGSTLGTSTGTGTTAHDHPIVFTASGNLTDMSVRYTDFIIASKN